MNTVFISGVLTKDPIIKNGVARFTMAVDRRFKSGSGSADYIGCVAFGPVAELINSLKKGAEVSLQGRIQTGSYLKEGRRIYTTDVVVEEAVELSSRRAKAEEADSASTVPEPAPVRGTGSLSGRRYTEEELKDMEYVLLRRRA